MLTDDLSPWPVGAPPEPALCDEGARASVLAAYGLDALEDDPELSQITSFAAKLCDAPIALVSLVEKERQRFLARAGIEERETPRPTSFCAHAMLEAEPLIVSDAAADERFSTNPLVTGYPNIRFYAGAPLISHEGAPLGSLCVIDTKPRKDGLTAFQREGLQVLAASVMRRLRYRREALVAQKQVEDSERQLRALADSIPDIAWTSSADGRYEYVNRRWHEFTGSGKEGAEKPGEIDFEAVLHPDDRIEWKDKWEAARQSGEPYQAEYRMRNAQGGYNWMLARGLPALDGEGRVHRWFGTLTDIDASHKQSEQRDLLARELSHRIKNIFAVIAGLVSLRARKRPEAREFADELTSAIRALGRAHDYVRPLDGRKSNKLAGLFEELLAPYDDKDGRIAITGDTCAIGSRAATPLALVFHELATNSAKYGALSSEAGTIGVNVQVDGESVRIEWRERGGPKPDDATEEGFGSRLVKMSVEGQLEGTIERRWVSDGVDIDLSIPLPAITG